jgi:hypothetical protein
MKFGERRVLLVAPTLNGALTRIAIPCVMPPPPAPPELAIPDVGATLPPPPEHAASNEAARHDPRRVLRFMIAPLTLRMTTSS